MIALDLLAVVAIGYGLIKGFFNGMVKEIFNLVAVVVGLWLGMRIAFLFANYYKDNTELSQRYIPFLAFLTAFILILACILLLSRMIDRWLDSSALNLPNQLMGALFGGLKWAFIIGTFLSLIGNSQYLSEASKESSAAYKPLTAYCSAVNQYTIALIPGAGNVYTEMKDYFLDMAHQATAPDSTLSRP
jgi:membrane protein required for colicin V production